MTITSLPTRNEYTASAGQTIFNYTFKIFEDTDLNVYVTPSGQEPNDITDMVTPSSVTGVGDSAGGAVTISATTAGDLVTIVADIPELRTVDYQNNGDFRPETVNDDFDRVVALTKQVASFSNRTLTFQEAQQGASGLSLSDPVGGMLLRWNGGGTGVENYALSTEILLSSVDSIAFLRTIDISDFSDGDNVIVNGYYVRGDGGGGPTRILYTGAAPSTYIDNGGSIIVPNGGDGSAAWLWPVQPRVNVDWFGAHGNGNGDVDSPSGSIDDDFIENAVAYFEGLLGIVEFSNKFYRINHLKINQRIICQGTASRLESIDGISRTGTVLQVHNTVSTLAVELVNHSCGLENVVILGETGNTADGVQFMGNSDFLEGVTVMNMGGNGIIVGDINTNGNRNNWYIRNVTSRSNLGNGCVVEDLDPGAGPDVNAGMCFGLNCQLNGGDGLVIGNGAVNNYHGLKTEGNTGVGVRIKENSTGGSSVFHNPHSEANYLGVDPTGITGQFVMEENTFNNYVYGSLAFIPENAGGNIVNLISGGSSKNMFIDARNYLINSVNSGFDAPRYSNSLTTSLQVEGETPGFVLSETDAPTDEKTWVHTSEGGNYKLKIVSEDQATVNNVMEVSRDGAAVGTVKFPNSNVIIGAGKGIGVGNIAIGDVTGTAATKNMPILNENSVVVGYIPVYVG